MEVKTTRSLRGGSWYDSDNYLRVAYRFLSGPLVSLGTGGFRCVSEPSTLGSFTPLPPDLIDEKTVD